MYGAVLDFLNPFAFQIQKIHSEKPPTHKIMYHTSRIKQQHYMKGKNLTMSHDISLSTAVDALREHFGEQLRAGRDEGRDMMVDALTERLSISKGDAEQAVEALEQSRTIQWVEVDAAQDIAIGAPSTGQGMPLGVEEAYWQF